jgi:hypothetical protein
LTPRRREHFSAERAQSYVNGLQPSPCLPSPRRRRAVATAFLAAILLSGVGRAEEPATTEPTTAEPTTAEPTTAEPVPAEPPTTSETKISVRLKVSLGDSTLSANAIEGALEDELGVPVEKTEGASDLELILQAGRVTARAPAARGRIVERSIDLPESQAEQLQVITLLSENLLRDEAGALLADLSASEQAAAASEMPTEPIPDPVIEQEPEFGPLSPAGLAFTRDVEVPNKKASVAFALAVPDGQWRNIRGLGISAFMLSSTHRSQGLSIAAAMHEAGAFDGLSIAGLYDGTKSAEGGFHGLRISGLYSYGAGNMYGLQISGFAGLTQKRMIGLGIAPYNHAGDATAAVQIGVFNYSEKGGTQIGVVNVHRKGKSSKIGVLGFGPGTRQQFVTWVQGTNLTNPNPGMPDGPTGNVGFRIQSQYLTTMVHAGLGVDAYGGAALFVPGYTIGARLPVSKVWSFELDMQHRMATNGPGVSFLNHLVAFRGSVVARVHPVIAVFAAAGPELVMPGGWLQAVQEHIALGVQVL